MPPPATRSIPRCRFATRSPRLLPSASTIARGPDAGRPVLAGSGATSLARAAELTAAAAAAGADAVLAWPPPGSEDLAGYFATVAGAAAGLPVLAYHIPWIWHSNPISYIGHLIG